MSHWGPSYRAKSALAALGITLGAGCAGPFQGDASDTLRATVIASARWELGAAQANPEPASLTRRPNDLDFPAHRLTELGTMAGPASYAGEDPTISQDLADDIPADVLDALRRDEPWLFALGPDLLGQQTRVARVGLEGSLAAGVTNNLSVQIARLAPGIRQSQIVAAEAAFDWVFFGDATWTRTDEPSVVPVVGGFPVGVGARGGHNASYTTGIRKPLTSGGLFSLSQGQLYTDDESPGSSRAPDPSNQVFLEVGLDQPLLRGFGSDVALADIHLTRNAERSAVLDLKNTLLQTVTDTERAYWDLVRANRTLRIQQRLLLRGLATRRIVKSRLAFDAKPAEYSDAVATVERRRANVIRAANALRQASDRLKTLVNDPSLPVGDETVLIPGDAAMDTPITFSLLDALSTALIHRPEIERSLLTIDDASIRQAVADNARLPVLNLAFQARFNGLDRDVSESYERIAESDFVNLLVSLTFEQAIGNRAAEAGYRGAQLQRMQTAVAYRQAVQQLVLSVKIALRNLRTNYQLIEQTRASRLAATENLRTLQVLEETVQSLSPDFLDLKFRRQESLAQAELEETQAIVDYNIALAEYHAALGTALERNGIRFVTPDAPFHLSPSETP